MLRGWGYRCDSPLNFNIVFRCPDKSVYLLLQQIICSQFQDIEIIRSQLCKITMEEYLAYSEISKDSLVPLVAVVNSSNGTVTYRDLVTRAYKFPSTERVLIKIIYLLKVKNDILFLLDHDHSENDDEHPMKADPMGGWLFKSSGQNKSSWVRRYVMLKGFLSFILSIQLQCIHRN